MSTILQLNQHRKLVLGANVARTTELMVTNTSKNIFTVTGGRVVVLGLLGELTVAESGTTVAFTCAIASTPTTGSAVTIATATSFQASTIGSHFSLPYTLGAALIVNAAGGGDLPMNGFVIPVGNISYVTAGATGTTLAQAKWDIFYVPLDDGAYITAA